MREGQEAYKNEILGGYDTDTGRQGIRNITGSGITSRKENIKPYAKPDRYRIIWAILAILLTALFNQHKML